MYGSLPDMKLVGLASYIPLCSFKEDI